VKFVNDPKDFPKVGSGAPALIGPRTQSGEAYLWEPGGDAEALVAFLGDLLVNVGGVLYERRFGSLHPAEFLSRAVVIVKPPAGEPFFLDPVEAERTYARVESWVVSTKPLPQADPASFALVDGEVAGQGDKSEGDRADCNTVADAPAKRPPGRPKGSTNKPKE
jgi:hypothetical protein